ncbi:MAG: ribosome silencing factor [Rhizobiaceae bacterium]|nr:ribosome silencing factor [Rhizobiaceae bacterium]
MVPVRRCRRRRCAGNSDQDDADERAESRSARGCGVSVLKRTLKSDYLGLRARPSCACPAWQKGRTTLRHATPTEGAPIGVSSEAPTSEKTLLRPAIDVVIASLEDSKGEEIFAIDLRGKSALADHMVIVSGRSNRHVTAVADHLLRDLKEHCLLKCKVEGLQNGDWVLIDAGDIIVHIFRPEVRTFYNIEKMWSVGEAADATVH